MYIIRFQKYKQSGHLKYKIIVIKKGAAVQNQSFVDSLGYYNKDSNIIKLKIDLFYKWLGRGAEISSPVYKLLGTVLKI